MSRKKTFADPQSINCVKIYERMKEEIKNDLHLSLSKFAGKIGITKNLLTAYRIRGISENVTWSFYYTYIALYYQIHDELPSWEKRKNFHPTVTRPDIFI